MQVHDYSTWIARQTRGNNKPSGKEIVFWYGTYARDFIPTQIDGYMFDFYTFYTTQNYQYPVLRTRERTIAKEAVEEIISQRELLISEWWNFDLTHLWWSYIFPIKLQYAGYAYRLDTYGTEYRQIYYKIICSDSERAQIIEHGADKAKIFYEYGIAHKCNYLRLNDMQYKALPNYHTPKFSGYMNDSSTSPPAFYPHVYEYFAAPTSEHPIPLLHNHYGSGSAGNNGRFNFLFYNGKYYYIPLYCDYLYENTCDVKLNVTKFNKSFWTNSFRLKEYDISTLTIDDGEICVTPSNIVSKCLRPEIRIEYLENLRFSEKYPPEPIQPTPPKKDSCRIVFTESAGQAVTNGTKYTANAKKHNTKIYAENAKADGGCGTYGNNEG